MVPGRVRNQSRSFGDVLMSGPHRAKSTHLQGMPNRYEIVATCGIPLFTAMEPNKCRAERQPDLTTVPEADNLYKQWLQDRRSPLQDGISQLDLSRRTPPANGSQFTIATPQQGLLFTFRNSSPGSSGAESRDAAPGWLAGGWCSAAVFSMLRPLTCCCRTRSCQHSAVSLRRLLMDDQHDRRLQRGEDAVNGTDIPIRPNAG